MDAETIDAKQLMEDRLFVMKNAVSGKEKINRIPFLSNVWSWKYLDAGFKLTEALYDYDNLEKSIIHYVESYTFDVPYDTGWSNMEQVTETLGGLQYTINDDVPSMCINDTCYMLPEEYDLLIKDPKKYLWETFLPRKHPKMNSKTSSIEFKQMLDEYGKYGAALNKITALLADKYGYPLVSDYMSPIGYWNCGVELLFGSLRGIKGLAMDIRRHPDKVEEAINAIDSFMINAKLKAGGFYEGTCPYAVFDGNPVLMAQTVFSIKQFERYYWPYIKKIDDYIQKYNKLCFIFAEGENKRFYDFFRDIESGKFAFYSELNDIYATKKDLPNMAMVGGLMQDTLGHGTPEDCVNEAKKLIDTIGKDGKFIIMEQKMVAFQNDLKSENYKAVTEFVAKYRI